MARFSLGMRPSLNKFFIEIRIIKDILEQFQRSCIKYIEKSLFFFSHYAGTFYPNSFATRFIFRSLPVPRVTARDLLSEK